MNLLKYLYFLLIIYVFFTCSFHYITYGVKLNYLTTLTNKFLAEIYQNRFKYKQCLPDDVVEIIEVSPSTSIMLGVLSLSFEIWLLSFLFRPLSPFKSTSILDSRNDKDLFCFLFGFFWLDVGLAPSKRKSDGKSWLVMAWSLLSCGVQNLMEHVGRKHS